MMPGPNATTTATTATTSRPCPVCGQPVAPDALGLVECACGWGGPGDPLESASGLARAITRWDRRAATTQARRELGRMQRRPGAPIRPGLLYTASLTLASTFIFAFLLACLAGSVWLTIYMALGATWLGVAVGLVLVVVFAIPFVPSRHKPIGVYVPLERYPRLAAVFQETSARTGIRPPDRVLLSPGANFFAFRRRPLKRLFRREMIVGVGAGALPIMSDLEVKAILAHELAHHSHGDTGLHAYFGRAEAALHHLIQMMGPSADDQRGTWVWRRRRGVRGNVSGGVTAVNALITWTMLLPFRLLWTAFHFMRLRESRGAEFEADRVAVTAFGSAAFINGLTAVRITMNTLRNSGNHLAAKGNYYAAARAHYAALPPSAMAQIRAQSISGYRTLESTHPITPDRLRAAYIVNAPLPAHGAPPRPASDLLLPARETSAEAIERELTALLFKKHNTR